MLDKSLAYGFARYSSALNNYYKATAKVMFLNRIRARGEVSPDLMGSDDCDLALLRRSSVAVIFRSSKPSNSLDDFLSKASSDDLELLLIKRSISAKDRWSGHVALPGGRQDSGETDLETAKRETLEEVGVDLDECGSLIGPLDQRLLRIKWGTRVAMVLCPFVFAVHDPDVQLTPQVSEVAAAFWYPWRLLRQNPSKLEVPIGDRFPLPFNLAPNMLFPAIPLHPTIQDPPPPYFLWGVTLAVLSDVIYLENPSVSLQLPTLKPLDMRVILKFLLLFKKLPVRQPYRLDIVNRLLVGHFKPFPWSICLGYLLRAALVTCMIRRLAKFVI